MISIEQIVTNFSSISLDEMDAVSLLKRTDTKYIFSKDELLEILPELMDYYYILDVDGIRIALYDSIYWDTPGFKFHRDHHNGKPDRFKVRMRKYVYSELCFLEVKHKIKGKTDKKRVLIEDFEKKLSDNSKFFIEKHLKQDLQLELKSRNTFNRITLVSKTDKERLTIDFGLSFETEGKKVDLPNLVIGEVKQERINRNSVFMKVLKKRLIRTERVSKYCIGNSFLFASVKYNKFKPKIIKIHGITNGLVA